MSVVKLLTDEEEQWLYQEYHKFLQFCKSHNVRYQMDDFFTELRETHSDFDYFTNKELSNKIIALRRTDGVENWPKLSELDNYFHPQVISFIEKAYSCALLAVEIYNKPIISFRSEGYIVQMMIAWTSLFHAIFLKDGIAITYNKDEPDNFLDLRKCIKKYNGILKKEISANLGLLVDIRDVIVHRDNTSIDDELFGYCQACLNNFNEVLVESFGNKYQLHNTLAYSLQFSKKYTNSQIDSIKKYRHQDENKFSSVLEKYNEELASKEPEIFRSQSYCFRVYIIPKAVKENRSDGSIEFINYDNKDSEIVDELDKAILLIKETRAGGEYYKFKQVVTTVEEKLRFKMRPGWKFSSYQHLKCIRFFRIREGYKTDTPDVTDKQYCFYDPIFEQYLYTKDWINFLVKKLSDVDTLVEIFGEIFTSKKIRDI
jgi:hypothetical protein